MKSSVVSVLVVEDNEDKQAGINAAIRARTPDAEIKVVISVAAGKQALREKTYDLVLLDLLLPLSDYGGPSRNGGLTLLEILHTDPSMLHPRYVVGITSFEEIADEQRSDFEAKTWCIVRYDPSGSDWVEQLNAVLSYIDRTKIQESQTDYLTDVFFITALRKPEFAAVLQLPITWGPALEPVGDEHFLRRGKTQFSARSVSVIAAYTAKMGMVWTALLVDRIIREFRPRVVVMCGICMGIPGETKLGDLIVAAHSWNWQAGKLAADKAGLLEFRVQPEPVVASAKLCNLWHEFDSAELEKLHASFSGRKPVDLPTVHVAPMVSGSSVIANDIIHPDITKQDRKIRGVDMETLGVYAACDSATNPKPKFLSVKAVTDWGVPEKADDFQDFCSYLSAQSVFSFLETFWQDFDV